MVPEDQDIHGDDEGYHHRQIRHGNYRFCHLTRSLRGESLLLDDSSASGEEPRLRLFPWQRGMGRVLRPAWKEYEPLRDLLITREASA
jgi:hypothetical protein